MLHSLNPLAGSIVCLVEPVAEQGDEVGHFVGCEPERGDADVVTPEREDDCLLLLVPSRPKQAAISAEVGEDRPGAGRAQQGHVSLWPRPGEFARAVFALPRLGGLPEQRGRNLAMIATHVCWLDRNVERAEGWRPPGGSSAQVSLFYATAWKVSLKPSASQTLSTVDQVGLPWSESAL